VTACNHVPSWQHAKTAAAATTTIAQCWDIHQLFVSSQVPQQEGLLLSLIYAAFGLIALEA
jgi:hypothetical protein